LAQLASRRRYGLLYGRQNSSAVNAFSQQRLSAFAVRHRLRYTIVVVANCSIPHNPDRQSLTFRYRPERGIQHPLSRGHLLRSLTRALSLLFVVLLSRSDFIIFVMNTALPAPSTRSFGWTPRCGVALFRDSSCFIPETTGFTRPFHRLRHFNRIVRTRYSRI